MKDLLELFGAIGILVIGCLIGIVLIGDEVWTN